MVADGSDQQGRAGRRQYQGRQVHRSLVGTHLGEPGSERQPEQSLFAGLEDVARKVEERLGEQLAVLHHENSAAMFRDELHRGIGRVLSHRHRVRQPFGNQLSP